MSKEDQSDKLLGEVLIIMGAVFLTRFVEKIFLFIKMTFEDLESVPFRLDFVNHTLSALSQFGFFLFALGGFGLIYLGFMLKSPNKDSWKSLLE
ncbi:hypothetical protein HOG16_05075 [Candidatus Woesearchaeota archaeon]|jgi:hypothetical protein|nr:hypothetical protein [archaeon]MBT3691582.1 hypothetical protein [Candidatus Woesearchaeota archaeon]MBT4373530.1 hypothetical protein [archaeon]MBT4531978.1 hypothetical protein [archaeon]MBT7001645.1 hypothetical protein [archaeon]